MTAITYEVWIKPDSGPLIVQERDARGLDCWFEKQTAVSLADSLHARHPHIHFIVRESQGHHGPYAKVHDTSSP